MPEKHSDLTFRMGETCEYIIVSTKRKRVVANVFIYDETKYTLFRKLELSKQDLGYVKLLFSEIPDLLKKAKTTQGFDPCIEIRRKV